MLKIRLSRTGKKSQPSFRVVVQEHTAAVKGKALESLGDYRPALNPKKFTINLERVKHWISVGAKPSDTVASLLKKEGVADMDRFMAPRNQKRKSKKGGAAAAEGAAATTPAAAPAQTAKAPAEAPKA